MPIFQQPVANRVAEYLLDCEAVKLSIDQPYTWASGWKSPIYCDNRITLSFPFVRSFIKNQLVQMISNHFPEVEAIAGVATGGIPQGTLVADEMELPFVYVRAEAKGHGLQNRVEGRVNKGQKLVVVEDLISTGKSSISAVDALRESGAEVLGIVSVFTYGFSVAGSALAECGISCFPLTDYPSLIAKALEKGIISESDISKLESWRKNPALWEK